jgi:predicted alpha/beta superfamily hydrolase
MRLLLIFIFATSIYVFGQKTGDFSIGQIHQIESEILKENRKLNIHLPSNFHQDSVYPVIYLLDGSAHEDFLHVVGLLQFFQLQFFMPDFIVVGIENVDRKRDFTFYPSDTSFLTDIPSAGQSGKFIEFIELELQPYIESIFKTNETKYLIGQSLGGLLATEVLLKKPELFSNFFIVSPSLWWDNASMLNQAMELLKKQTVRPEFVYIAVGKKEHKIMRRDARKLYKYVKNGKSDKQKLYLNKMKKENHASILHLALYDGFKVLFPNM